MCVCVCVHVYIDTHTYQIPSSHEKFSPSQIYFALPGIVWTAFLIHVRLLLN
jgi:hypothetical protein